MKKGSDYIGVGVGAVIVSPGGKIFLAKRGRNVRNEAGTWEFPGGSVEFGERIEDAIIREIREEYGMSVIVERLLDVVNHILPEEKQHWVSPTFLCRHKGGTPRILEPDKCDEIGWFDMDDIPSSRLSLASSRSLESYRNYLEKARTDSKQ